MDVVGVYHYYPYGKLIENRTWEATDARFGFQGQERDDEVAGAGNSLSTFYRLNRSDISIWLTPDPKMDLFPGRSTYTLYGNNPINRIDPRGDLDDGWMSPTTYWYNRTRNSNTLTYSEYVNSGKYDGAIKVNAAVGATTLMLYGTGFVVAEGFAAYGKAGFVSLLAREGIDECIDQIINNPIPMSLTDAGQIGFKKAGKSFVADGTDLVGVGDRGLRRNATNSQPIDKQGIIYLREDMTGELKPYVGQTKSDMRFIKRKGEHKRVNPKSKFEFMELERGNPTGDFPTDLDIKEQKWLDFYKGPTNKSNPKGGTSNKKNVIKKGK